MITLYSGTPGSGKSYHAARTITEWVKRDKPIVANFTIDESYLVGSKSTFLYVDNSELTPAFLVRYALDHNQRGKEGQMLVVIDEAQVIFNCRSWNAKAQQDWVKLMSQHRKLGMDILLIAQADRMLDRQIRYLIEVETKHRKLNNYGFGGKVWSLVTGCSTWFLAINYWYGGNKTQLDHEMIRYKKRIGALYDSYAMFDGAEISGLLPDIGNGETLVVKEMARRKADSAQNNNLDTVSEGDEKPCDCGRGKEETVNTVSAGPLCEGAQSAVRADRGSQTGAACDGKEEVRPLWERLVGDAGA